MLIEEKLDKIGATIEHFPWILFDVLCRKLGFKIFSILNFPSRTSTFECKLFTDMPEMCKHLLYSGFNCNVLTM